MGEFARFLRDAMALRGFGDRGGQARLARASGIDTSYLNRIAQGKVERPEPETLRKLAQALPWSLDELARAAERLPAEVAQNGPPDGYDSGREPSLLRDAVARLEADPDEELQEFLKEVRRVETSEGYRQIVEYLAGAWKGNVRMFMLMWRRRRGEDGERRAI
jgi:transcriptional regulator with XRE-family HTH domain